MTMKIGEERQTAQERAKTQAEGEAHRQSHKGATVESLAAAAKARQS